MTEQAEAGPDREIRRFAYERTLLTVAIDGEVTTRMAHDRTGRQRTVTWSAPGIDPMTVGYEYDLQGAAAATLYPDGTRIVTERGPGGNPQRMPGIINAIEYDANSRMTRVAFLGDIEIRQEHDATTHWLTRAVLRGPAGVLREAQWEHEEDGEVRAILDTLPGRSIRRQFAYDAFRRLSEATTTEGSASEQVTYAYNAVDDLLSGESGPVPPDLRDDTGQVSALPDGTALAWDVWGRLTEARRSDGATVRWRYDFRGNPVTREVTDAAGTRVTAYAGQLYERNSDHERLNIFLGSSPIACRIRRGAAAHTLVALLDPHGSPLASIDLANGTVFQHLYTPFGSARLLAGASPEPGRWLSRAPDDMLGVVLLGRRVYAPALSRSLGPDWYVIEAPQRALAIPAALNAYAYGLNNPVRYRDAGGAWFGWDDLIVAGIGFAVGFAVGAYMAHERGDSWFMGGLEGGLVGAAGAWLGYNTGGFVFSKLGWAPGWLLGKLGVSVCVSAKALAITGAVIGGLNGVLSGARGIYDWSDPSGYLAFASDSSWSLTGTGLGLLLQIGASGYRDELSRRSNRHIYDGGFGIGSSAFTQGNVTSNWGGRSGTASLHEHESSHAWQSRIVGPAYQLTYVAWDDSRGTRRNRHRALHRSAPEQGHQGHGLLQQSVGADRLRHRRHRLRTRHSRVVVIIDRLPPDIAHWTVALAVLSPARDAAAA